MRIALLGATGFVGSAILNEALDRAHTVTAVVPNGYSGLLICDHRTGRRSWNEPSREGQARRA